MREILFRGKRTDNGEWETGSLVVIRGGCSDEQIYIADKMTGYNTPVLKKTVGQYTGLTDKNGEKIFEGDIVDILTENEEIGVVEYDDGGFEVKADGFTVDFHSNICGTDLEVIGNIYDNPELLEG